MNPDSRQEMLARLTAICSLIASSIAVFVLVSWAFGQWRLGTFGSGYIPMAPSTALLLGLLGAALLAQARWPAKRVTVWLSLCVAALAGAWGLLVAGETFLGWPLRAQSWLGPAGLAVHGIPVGWMSPLTALVFVMSAAALALESGRWRARRFCRYAVATLAIGVLLVCETVLLGYASGSPLLYRSGTVPMALVTALAFVALGAGVLCTAWMTSARPAPAGGQPTAGAPPSRWPARRLAIVYLLLVVAAGSAAWSYLRIQQMAARQEMEEQLGAIADLKVLQITQWRRERLADAALFARAAAIARAARDIETLLGDPASETATAAVTHWLTLLKAGDHYDWVALFDAQGKLRLSVPSGDKTAGRILCSHLSEVLRGQQVVMSDLHRGEDSSGIHMDVAFPIFPPPGRSALHPQPSTLSPQPSPIAVILLRINPQRFLYPLLQLWPAPSATAEMLLARRDGDDMLFLNELRHRKGAAMTLRLPANSPHLPAAMGARGDVGAREGVDYRGVPVLAVLRAVPETPWVMVTKVDQAELYAPLRERTWSVGLLVGMLLLAGGLGLTLIRRAHDAQFLQHEMALERERKIAAERLAHLMRHANDMILLADAAGRIVEANDRALETHGLSLAEMRQMTLENLRTPASRANYGRDCKRMTTHGGALFEAEHQRKDGTFFPAEISARLVQIGGVTYQLNIIRDITKRRKAEKALRESEEKFRSLFDHSADAVFVEDSGGTVLDVNPAACRLHGLKREQLIGRHVRDLVPAEHRERVVRDFPKWFTGELTQYEGFTLTADGRAVPVEIRGAPVSYAGQPALLLHVRDITERRRAEAALRQTEEKYRNIFENAVEGIYQSTPDGRILSANPAMAAIHGYASPDEFIANVNDIARQLYVDPGRREVFKRLMEEHGQVFNFESQVRRKDGSLIWVSASARAVRGADGKILYYEGLVEDISERKRIEVALRESNERLTALFEGAQDAILIADADTGIILNANAEAEELLGRPRNQIIGLHQSQLHPPAEVEKYRALFRSHADHSGGFADGAEVQRADGSRVVVEINASIVNLSGGQRVIQGLFRDITERKRVEKELRESEERFRSLSASSPLGIFLADTEGQCVYVNPRFRELFGLSLGATVGGGWLRFVLAEDRASLETAWVSAVRQRQEFAREFRVQAKQHEARWMHLRTSPMVSGEGALSGHVGTVEDITDRKQAENELRELSGLLLRAQEEERRRIGKELHDSTAQELAAVVMNLNALHHRLPGRDKEAQTLVADSLAILEHSARDVRTLSHLLHPPFLEEVGLLGALRQYVIGFSQRSGIQIETELPESWDRLSGDEETALFRVVQEALGNVHRHSGSLTAAVRLRRTQEAITLEVEDRGRGMARAKDAAEEPVVGVGILGMRERMRQIGGALEIESDEKGTMVRATIAECGLRIADCGISTHPQSPLRNPKSNQEMER